MNTVTIQRLCQIVGCEFVIPFISFVLLPAIDHYSDCPATRAVCELTI